MISGYLPVPPVSAGEQPHWDATPPRAERERERERERESRQCGISLCEGKVLRSGRSET
jgi:hypothetical protein